jgi:hypothetical protein
MLAGCGHSVGVMYASCHVQPHHPWCRPFSSGGPHRRNARGMSIRAQQQQQQQSGGGAGSGILSIFCPLLKLVSGTLLKAHSASMHFSSCHPPDMSCLTWRYFFMSEGGDAAAPRARWAEVATSGFASISRLPFGTTVGPGAAARSNEPAQTLQLFEFEACPFCRQADTLDPCHRQSTRMNMIRSYRLLTFVMVMLPVV